MRLGLKISVAFTLALLIVGGVGIQSYLGIQRITETNQWVAHSHEVIENLEHALSVLKDAETGQRGFVLTGEDHYLEPYNAAAGEIQKDIDKVASLTADNPEQQADIQRLRKLSDDKLDELRETIKLRRESGLEAALPVIRTDRGRKIMDDARKLVGGMEGRERQLLDVRNRAANEVASQSMRTIGLGVLLSLLVLGIAAVIVTRTMRLADPGPTPKGAGGTWPKIAIRYAFAVAMVALATGARWLLERYVGPMPIFLTWYPAVLLVATIAGGGPGILATLLSALAADYWFIAPFGQFSILGTNDAVAMGIFFGTGIFVSVLAERLRRARYSEAVSATQERELSLLNMGNVMALDLDHRIVRWSEGNHRLYGFDAREAQGQLTYEFLHTHLPQPLEQIHDELKQKNYWQGEVTRRCKDGTQLSLSILWALRRDERGEPLAILEVSTDITPQKAAEESLRQQSEELAQQNEELTQQTEELARQSEELTQQSEELSEQNEELQTQSEEIQAMNAELGHREKTLQTLLDAARLPVGEQEVMGQVCQAAMEMIGQPAFGAVVCERRADELHILAYAGFGGADVPASWPANGSFVEMVMQQDRTASLEDTSLRPDLRILPIPGHSRFAALLSSPVHVKGKPIGAVSIFSNQAHPWTAEQFRLIEWLAAKCSNTLETMRLATEVRQAQEQNEFLADILEASSQAFGVGYPNGQLGMINKAFEQLTGYTGDELRSIDWANTLTPPQWREIERRKLEELGRTGLPVRYEKEYLRKDGARVPIELLVGLEKDAQGKPLYYYSFITDITERKRAQIESDTAGEFLKIINQSANTRELVHEAVTFFHRQTGCEAVGVRLKDGDDYPYYEARGFPEEFLLLENSLCERDVNGGIQRDSAGSPCIACMCGNVICGRFDPSKPFFSPQGSFWSNGTTELLASSTDADRKAKTRNRCNGQGYESVALIALRFGENRLGLLQFNDKRKGMFSAQTIALWERLANYLAVALAKLRAEEALDKHHEELLTIMDSVPAWIFYKDTQNHFQRVNKAFAQVMGKSPEQLEGASLFDLYPRAQAEAFWKDDLEVIASGIARRNIVEPMQGGTELRWAQTDKIPYRDAQGKVIGIIGFAMDITERKRAEEALRASVQDLERSNKELEQFAYIASHDLQEPLRQVRAYVQLLRDRHADKFDGKAGQYFQFVQDGASRMSDLVRGLLDYSRVGAADAPMRPVPAQQALDAALGNLQTSIAESRARVTHDELPTVLAEPTQLAQLFQNLIGNAVKFRRDELEPQIHVGCRRNGSGWVFSVKDNGIGIEPEYHEKVFLIFQRLHGREKYSGTGIGLAICKKIVEQHGGRIWIESNPGQGTTFCFTLPEEKI